MYSIKELLKLLFKSEDKELVLDDRIEFRLNKKEKELIKKYCALKHISLSEIFRNLAIKDINTFFNINADEIEEIRKSIIINETKKPVQKIKNFRAWNAN